MIPVSIFLTVVSPYTAFLPMFFMAYRILKGNDVVYNNPWNTGLLLLFFWSFLTGMINKDPISSGASLAILLYFFVSVYFQNYYNEEYKIENLLKSTVLFSIFSVFIGIIEKITATYSDSIMWGGFLGIPSQVLARESYRIYSTFGNPNVAGSWFSSMIIICLYFYDNTDQLRKILYALAVLLFTAALFLTGSRGAAVGLELGLVTYALFRKDAQGVGFVVAISLLVMLLMFVPSNWFSLTTHVVISEPLSHDVGGSVSSREAIWTGCLNMFKLKPLSGWGLMGIYTEGRYFIQYSREPHGHNIWITITTTLGIVGLSIYLYMKLYLFEAIKLLLSCRSKMVSLLIGLQAMVIGHGLVDFTIMTPQGGIIFFGSSALITALALQYSFSGAGDVYSMYPWFRNENPAKLNL